LPEAKNIASSNRFDYRLLLQIMNYEYTILQFERFKNY